jgi:pre-mRNA-processing factor 40
MELSKKEEVRAVYIQMFQEAGVSSTWKWEDFQRIMKHDDRFNIIKTIGQKKQIFQEFLQILKKKDREDGRQKKQVARENFTKMLDSSGILRAESKYYKTSHFFQGDPRWRILEEKEREELFQDFLDELERRDREKIRQQRKQQMQMLRKVLEDNVEIDHTTKWSAAQKILADNLNFKALDKLDQLNVFSEFILEFEKNVSESKKLDERTKSRKNRENFRKLLEEYIKAGQITAVTHWKDIYQKLRDEPTYLNLVGQPGSTPKELFEDIINQEKSKLKEYKESMMDALANHDFSKMNSFEEIPNICKDVLDSIPENLKTIVLQLIYDEQTTEAKNKARKIRKHKRLYEEYLRSNANISSNSKYDDIESDVKANCKHFKRLDDDMLRSQFLAYLEKIKEEEQTSDIEPGEIKGKPKKKDKKEKRHKKHRRDDKKHKKKHKHKSSRSPVKFI